jgi:site-specific DNA recombinase
LVRLTNEELNQECDREKEKLFLLETQIAEVENRLGKLYDALETGEFKGGELASRIKALLQKKEELIGARAEAEEALHLQIIEPADPEIVRNYVRDLKQLLEESELVKKRAFLKSFVDRIEVGESTVKVNYTIPMPPSNLAIETVGVLPIIQNGSAYGIRTRGLRLERAASLAARRMRPAQNYGWGGRIRTFPGGSRVRCPTTRRLPSDT